MSDGSNEPEDPPWVRTGTNYSSPNDGPLGGGMPSRHPKSIVKRSRWLFAAAILASVATAGSVAISSVPATISSLEPSPGATSNADHSAFTSSYGSASATDTTSEGGVTVGECLATDHHPTSCNAIHRYEVVAVNTRECNADVAMPYLGGNRDLDVMRASFVLDDYGSCLVANADNTDRSASVRGILLSSVGDSFRLCRDDRTVPTTVGCDTAHTSEFVGFPADTVPDQTDCEAAASAYMDLAVREISDRLSIGVIPTSTSSSDLPSCVITVRGNEVLTASVRNLRTNALPMTAG